MQLMKSKDGGFTYVYSQTDVERLEGYGWRKAEPSEQVKKAVDVAPAVVIAEEKQVDVTPKAKPGRPKSK